MRMHTATVRRTGRRWKVTVGSGVAKVATLGDAKRTAEALAQQTLIWRRRTSDLWVADPPTSDQFDRLSRIHLDHWSETDPA